MIRSLCRTHKTSILTNHITFEIANYGIGGVYSYHPDADGEQGSTFVDAEQNRGDRLATFMGYLTDVDAGGATVFPTIGVTIWPKKGDAAYW